MTEMMKRYEAETGTQNCVEEQELKYMNECDIDLDEFGENGFRTYVCEKASAYDRLMSGGKVSNAKEAANFYGRPVASVDREWKVFENLPKYDGYRWWDMESRAFLSGETVHFNIDAFEGDEENSLTLPDGWEEK